MDNQNNNCHSELISESIIIDGVDVSGCCNNRCIDKAADGEKLYLCDEYIDGGCEGHNCYYKQLQRVKAENERLKEEVKQLEDFVKSSGEIDHIKSELKELRQSINDNPDTQMPYVTMYRNIKQKHIELEQENERLKEENYQLQKDCQICENFIDFIPCKPIRDMDYDLQKVISQRDNYYQALQEIREIFSHLDENNWFHTGKHIYMDDRCINEIKTRILTKINEVIGKE